MNLGAKLEDLREEVLNVVGHTMDPKNPARAEPQCKTRMYEELVDLPEQSIEAVKELDREIDELNAEKEVAVGDLDFEKAACLRDEADKLRKKREKIISKAKAK